MISVSNYLPLGIQRNYWYMPPNASCHMVIIGATMTLNLYPCYHAPQNPSLTPERYHTI